MERALNTSSVGDIKQQRFRSKEKAAVRDGGFNHGIESYYNDDGDYAGSAYYPSTSDSGLGITCTPSDGFTTGDGKKLKGFSSAKMCSPSTRLWNAVHHRRSEIRAL